MIKAVIFDADGTLLDSMGIWDELPARYLESHGITAHDHLSAELADKSLDEGCEYLRMKFELSYTAEAIRDEMTGILASFYRNEVQLKPGIYELVYRLKEQGILMAIATTGDGELICAALERLGILGCFKDRIFTCDDHATTKREPKIYDIAAKSMNGTPETTLVIEDALYAVRTAHDAGYVICAVYDASSDADREETSNTADLYVKDLYETESIMRLIYSKGE